MRHADQPFKQYLDRGLPVTGPGGIWLGLVTIAGAWSLALGVPFWLSALVFVCAVLPPLVGAFMRGSTSDAQAVEVESALWIALATAGAASTGGVSALIVIYGVAIGVAWASGRGRLTIEIAGFAILGLTIGVVAGSNGSWLHAHDAMILTTSYGMAGLVLLAATAIIAALRVREPREPLRVAPFDVHDATLRVQLEIRLRKAAQVALEARKAAETAKHQLEARTTFFAQTSHELRTPLNAIVGFAEMMRSGVFGPLPERYQEYAELIHEGGRNLTLIIDDVLDLARLEAGKYEIYPEIVSLSDLADDAVRFMMDEARRKGVDLVCDGPEDAEAFADSKAVRQIALNLISNALKFTPAGGEVVVVAEEVPGGSVLAVSDTGVGISPEELKRLSRAFEQGEAGKKQKGAGLGLSVVRAFAELHRGALTIEPREAGGTRIAVFFPEANATKSSANL